MAANVVRRISAGPGELDIANDVYRKLVGTGLHHYMKFGSSKYVLANPECIVGGRWPVTITSVGWREGKDPNDVVIAGFVMIHDWNPDRYHYFTATYNVRTREGEATFENVCRDCGSELNPYGRCNRRECQPKHSCMKVWGANGACPNPPTHKREQDGLLVCEKCAHEIVGTFVKIV